jgi:Cu/Ag efflux protein CusF
MRHASIFFMSIALAGCGAGGEAPRSSPPAETFYAIRGLVKGVAADRRSVTIDHEEIPGFMPRMEMEYVVTDPALLDGIEPGAQVEGTLRMRGRGLSIVRLQKRRPPATPSTRAG